MKYARLMKYFISAILFLIVLSNILYLNHTVTWDGTCIAPEWEQERPNKIIELMSATVLGNDVRWPFVQLYLVIMLLIIIGRVTDMHFVQTLNYLTSQKEEGVQGSLFLAMGSSAPELFTSVAGIMTETVNINQQCATSSLWNTTLYNTTDDCFRYERDASTGVATGMSTIAGSAIVNILIVILASAWSVGRLTIKKDKIDDSRVDKQTTPLYRACPQPLIPLTIDRDVSFYTFSIVLLIYFFIRESKNEIFKLYWIDTMLLVGLYIMYVCTCVKDGTYLKGKQQRNLMELLKRKKKDPLPSGTLLGESGNNISGAWNCFLWEAYRQDATELFHLVYDPMFRSPKALWHFPIFIVFGCIIPIWILSPLSKFLVDFVFTLLPVPVIIDIDSEITDNDHEFAPSAFVGEVRSRTNNSIDIMDRIYDEDAMMNGKKIGRGWKGKDNDAGKKNKDAWKKYNDSSTETDNLLKKKAFKTMLNTMDTLVLTRRLRASGTKEWCMRFPAFYIRNEKKLRVLTGSKLETCCCIVMLFFHLLLLGWLSFIMVALVVDFGGCVDIPIPFLGVTVLALGTSIPDIFGSMSAMKDSGADKAIGSAYGSNTFDICVGMGFVYFCKLLYDIIVYKGISGFEWNTVYLNIGKKQDADIMFQSFISIGFVILLSYLMIQIEPDGKLVKFITDFEQNFSYQYRRNYWIRGDAWETIPCIVGYLSFCVFFTMSVFGSASSSWEYFLGFVCIPMGLVIIAVYARKQNLRFYVDCFCGKIDVNLATRNSGDVFYYGGVDRGNMKEDDDARIKFVYDNRTFSKKRLRKTMDGPV